MMLDHINIDGIYSSIRSHSILQYHLYRISNIVVMLGAMVSYWRFQISREKV